jgi:hypothetical protein
MQSIAFLNPNLFFKALLLFLIQIIFGLLTHFQSVHLFGFDRRRKSFSKNSDAPRLRICP